MYIDLAAKRLVKLDGALFKDVNFGWGILGRLYKGGKFSIKQADIGSGVWEETEEILQFNGKVMLVKPLQIDSRETRTDFRPVPSQVTTAQALDLLHKAVAAGYKNATSLKESPDLEVLRSDPAFRGEFEKLIASIKQ